MLSELEDQLNSYNTKLPILLSTGHSSGPKINTKTTIIDEPVGDYLNLDSIKCPDPSENPNQGYKILKDSDHRVMNYLV